MLLYLVAFNTQWFETYRQGWFVSLDSDPESLRDDMPENYVLRPLEVEEVRLQVILEGQLYPSEVEEARLLVKEAEGVAIHQGMDVGVVEHLLTLLEAVVVVFLMDV